MSENITFADIYEFRKKEIDGLRSNEGIILPKIAREYCAIHPGSLGPVSRAFAQWASVAKQWFNNPEDPALAFRFLDGHPALWSFSALNDDVQKEWYGIPSKGELEDESYFDIAYKKFLELSTLKTSGFAGGFWTGLGRHEGKDVYMMEMGSAVPPFRNHHYHDTDIDTWESSFEDCYIQHALGVLAVFGLDDRERKDPKLVDKWGYANSEGRIFYRSLRGFGE